MSVNTRVLLAVSVGLIVFGFIVSYVIEDRPNPTFDGDRALANVEYQLELGPRVVGTHSHQQVVDWMTNSLQASGWQVEVQKAERLGHPISNVIAKRGNGQPWIILGAHYDSRRIADRDSDPLKKNEPVPGANDGASGVAVLLELALTLPRDLDKEVWLVLFDAEDNGRIEGWDWILGSRAFAESLTKYPDSVVIVDMVGDADLQIYLEANSDADLSQEIWDQAAEPGYSDVFINEIGHSLIDDHSPFLELDIPAVDIIDFDYPYWHTSQDTLDKVSAESLKAVGDTLLAWVISQ